MTMLALSDLVYDAVAPSPTALFLKPGAMYSPSGVAAFDYFSAATAPAPAGASPGSALTAATAHAGPTFSPLGAARFDDAGDDLTEDGLTNTLLVPSLSASAEASRAATPSPGSVGRVGKCGHAHHADGRRANGHACGKRPEDFDTRAAYDRYANRRKRNNEAAFRSRQRKRARADESNVQLDVLQRQNAELTLRVQGLLEQVASLRELVRAFADR